jgi:hypothetical protein
MNPNFPDGLFSPDGLFRQNVDHFAGATRVA